MCLYFSTLEREGGFSTTITIVKDCANFSMTQTSQVDISQNFSSIIILKDNCYTYSLFSIYNATVQLITIHGEEELFMF